MDVEALLTAAVERLTPWIQESASPQPYQRDVVLAAADLLAAVEALQSMAWGHLSAITGVDLGVEVGQIEVIYHFCKGPAVLGLKVRVSDGREGRAAAVLPSICTFIPSATVFERELSEMFGVTVTGTPDPSRLFLPDEWPEGVYPLRKDFLPE